MMFTNEQLKKVAACDTHEQALKVVSQAELLELAQRFCRQTSRKLDQQKKMREMFHEYKEGR